MDALKKAAIKSFDLIRKNSDIDELKAVGDIVDICYYYAEKEFYILKEAKLQKTKEKVEIKSEMLNICEFMKTLGDNLDPYNVPIVMDSLVGSIESDMGIKAT